MNTLYKFAIAACTLLISLQCNSNQPTVSKHTETVVFQAKDFLKDRYYFLDNTYRSYYIRKYAPQSLNPTPPPNVTTLSVWRKYDRAITENKTNIKIVLVDTIDQTYLYERLERDRHYYLDETEGWIRFPDSISLQPNQQVAIFMRTENANDPSYTQIQKGRMIFDTLVGDGIMLDTLWTLWTIRPWESALDSAEVDTSRFHLMWRHAYGPVDLTDVFSMSVKVERIKTDSPKREEKSPEGIYYTDILGISVNNVPRIQNSAIFNRQFNDLVFPPFDTTDIGLEPFNNPALGEFRDSVFYRYSEALVRWKIGEGYHTIYDIAISVSRPDEQKE